MPGLVARAPPPPAPGGPRGQLACKGAHSGGPSQAGACRSVSAALCCPLFWFGPFRACASGGTSPHVAPRVRTRARCVSWPEEDPGLEFGRQICSPTPSHGPAFQPICLARGASRGAEPASEGGGGDRAAGLWVLLSKGVAHVDFLLLAKGSVGVPLQSLGQRVSRSVPFPLSLRCSGKALLCRVSPWSAATPGGGPGLQPLPCAAG